jgi:hypothetical protein
MDFRIADHPEVARFLPGVAGALVSMIFIREHWLRRLAMFAAGAALAIYGTPWAARVSNLDPGFAGFLLGMFGMALVAKVFDAWSDLELTIILRDALRKVLGLPPKGDPQ